MKSNQIESNHIIHHIKSNLLLVLLLLVQTKNHSSSSSQRDFVVQYSLVFRMKLFYFDISGKGDCIRLLCAHAGLPLEDIRIALDNRGPFDKLKSEGKLPFGQLPALQISETDPLITQSSAIMRYLGKVSGQSRDRKSVV